MIFSINESLEDSVIRTLLKEGASAISLQSKLANNKIFVTSQGVYKVLKALVEQEVLIKRGFIYYINEEWRNRLYEAIAKGSQSISISEGEKISFTLNSLTHLDLHWKNLVIPLHQNFPHDPIFLYNPHEIWIHLNEQRRASEYSYYASFAEKKVYAFCAFGGETVHEMSIKKELQNEYLQVAIGTEYFSKTDYPAIFNDYIITTRISKSLASKIESCYQSSEDMMQLDKKLRLIGIEKKKIKLSIERNKEKAKKLRKRMSKQFFVPKELVKKFNLY